MRRPLRLAALLSASLICLTVPARAQDMNMDVMNKWSAFTVIHYVVVGEYSGDPSINPGGGGFIPASATDHVELTFDWNQNETALVGTPVIKNFPGTMTPPPPRDPCPTMRVRVSGTYDHVTVTSVTPMANTLQLQGTRSRPAAVVPHMEGMNCVEGTVPATTHEVTMMLVVLPTVIFGMPAARGEGVSLSKDGKSIVAVDKENPGWTWTYTPTGLR